VLHIHISLLHVVNGVINEHLIDGGERVIKTIVHPTIKLCHNVPLLDGLWLYRHSSVTPVSGWRRTWAVGKTLTMFGV